MAVSYSFVPDVIANDLQIILLTSKNCYTTGCHGLALLFLRLSLAVHSGWSLEEDPSAGLSVDLLLKALTQEQFGLNKISYSTDAPVDWSPASASHACGERSEEGGSAISGDHYLNCRAGTTAPNISSISLGA